MSKRLLLVGLVQVNASLPWHVNCNGNLKKYHSTYQEELLEVHVQLVRIWCKNMKYRKLINYWKVNEDLKLQVQMVTSCLRVNNMCAFFLHEFILLWNNSLTFVGRLQRIWGDRWVWMFIRINRFLVDRKMNRWSVRRLTRSSRSCHNG